MKAFRTAGVVAGIVAAGISVVPAPAGATGAAEALMSPSCGRENLLAGRLPSAYQDARGSLAFPTDGTVTPEGAEGDAPVAVTFDTVAGSLTYDLGQPTPVSAFVVQADANDSYRILGSLDGAAGSFKVLGQVESVVHLGHGLRTRTLSLAPTFVRYLRVGEPIGDDRYSLAEFQAYCQAPTPFPPALRIVQAPPARVAVERPSRWWDNDASAREEMLLAILALALVGWRVFLVKKGTPWRFQKLRDGLLIAVGVVSFFSYWNFFSFHFDNYLHVWEAYHYYLGSKYFKAIAPSSATPRSTRRPRSPITWGCARGRVQPVAGGARAAHRSPGRSLGSLETDEAAHVPPADADLPAPVRGFRPAPPQGRTRRRALGGLLPGRHDDRRRGRAHLLLLLVPVRGGAAVRQAPRARRLAARGHRDDGVHRLGPDQVPAELAAVEPDADAPVARRAVRVDVGGHAGGVRLDPLPPRLSACPAHPGRREHR